MRVNIKSVLHGARWMVLRTIERCEVRPFCFNFRPICDIKTDAAEYILRPFPAVHHRMQGARPDTAAWQGDVNRFSGEAALHQGALQCFPPGAQRYPARPASLKAWTTRLFCLEIALLHFQAKRCLQPWQRHRAHEQRSAQHSWAAVAIRRQDSLA